MQLAIGAILKNEAPYILEWIAYHRTIGIQKFFLADNCSDDGSTELLASLDAAGVICHIPFPTVPGKPPQLQAYAEIMHRHRDDADWIAFIDADEFLTPTDGDATILPLIREIDKNPNVGAIAVNWAVYGSSHHREETEGLVIERFKQRSKQGFGANSHYKSIVRSKAWFKEGGNPHHFGLLPGYVTVHTNGNLVVDHETGRGLSSDIVWEHLRVNHYVVKSWSEFINRKRARGRATTTKQRPESFFHAHDKNDEDDPMPKRRIESTEKGIEELHTILKENVDKLPSMTLSKPDHALGSKVDTKALSISRGVLDSVTFDEFHLTVKGWAILEDGSPLPYLTPCIGSYPISTARLERIERPDVVRRFQGASLSCGFSISILLSDIPESLIYSEIKILGGREDRSIRFQISSSGRQWHEGLHVKYSSPFRGRDFLSETVTFKSRLKIETILDIGANTGQSVKEFKNKLPDSRIFAFEPVKSTYKKLVENVSGLNGVECFNSALGDVGTTEVYIENAPLSVDNKVVSSSVLSGVERVECVSGLEFCRQKNVDYIDFLKIDTEGYDLEVLKGFLPLLESNKISFVQVECGMNRSNKKHVNIYEILGFFKNLNFDFFGIYEQVRELDGRIPLRRANVVMVSSRIV